MNGVGSLSLRLVSQDDVAKAVLHISSEYCDAAGVPDDSIARDRSDMLPSVHYSESQFEVCLFDLIILIITHLDGCFIIFTDARATLQLSQTACSCSISAS